MSHTFKGIDPFLVTTPLANKGQWTNGTSADDGDSRDAASAMLTAEAAINRTNWLRWRSVNGLEDGGSYPADIDWTGNIVFGPGGSVKFKEDVDIENGGTLFIGLGPFGQGHLVVTGLSDMTLSALSNTYVLGAMTYSGAGASITITSSVTVNSAADEVRTGICFFNGVTHTGAELDVEGLLFRTGGETRSGDGAWTGQRHKTIPNTPPNVTIDATEADVWEIPVLSAQLTVTIANSTTEHAFVIRQANPVTQAFDCFIETSVGASIGKFFAEPGVGAERFGTIHYQYRQATSRPHATMVWTCVDSGNATELAKIG